MTAGTETAAVANGNGGAPSDEHLFPLDTFKDAAKHLRRPFTVHAVKFKVQATWEGNGAGGLIVSYIDARLAIERLNLICPHLWHDRYEAVSANRMWCHLTVDGITRADVGDGEGKGLVSDALKRAAVHFGVGVSLYAIPQIKLFLSDGHLRDTGRKDKKGKPIFELTPNGLGRCRQLYEAWLENAGKAAFGEPLDHGDVEEAVGDAEEAPATPGPPAEPPPKTITKKRAEELFEAAKAARLDGQRVSMWLTQHGVEHGEVTSKATCVEALRLMEEATAEQFAAAVAQHAANVTEAGAEAETHDARATAEVPS